jgi:hypothetical protein
VLADVGLLGMPNAGKSTLIAAVSNARPKIADYPFTTLHPNLGVVRVGPEKSFVVADIPGPDRGRGRGRRAGASVPAPPAAHPPAAASGRPVPFDPDADPVRDARAIVKELRKYDPELADKPRWLVLNKIDMIRPKSARRASTKFVKQPAGRGKQRVPVDRVLRGLGADPRGLRAAAARDLRLPGVDPPEPEAVEADPRFDQRQPMWWWRSGAAWGSENPRSHPFETAVFTPDADDAAVPRRSVAAVKPASRRHRRQRRCVHGRRGGTNQGRARMSAAALPDRGLRAVRRCAPRGRQGGLQPGDQRGPRAGCRSHLAEWGRQIAALRAGGKQVVMVSSGAIAEGMKRLGWPKRPHEIHEQQAAAAVGQMGLAQVYESFRAARDCRPHRCCSRTRTCPIAAAT